MPRIQLKIAGALSLLVVAVVAATGTLAERGARARITDQIERSLIDQAALLRHQLRAIPFVPERMEPLQRMTLEAASVIRARVTLIDASGRVLADSDLTLDAVAGVENHRARPEVAQALAGQNGRNTRRSATVKRDFLYVALPGPEPVAGERPGVVRLAMGLDQVGAAIAELRSELIAAGAIGLLAALGLSFALSLLTLRPIAELRDIVSDIAEGRLDRRLHWETRDERGEIAASVNRVARQMRLSVEEATHEKEQLEAVLASMVEGVLVLDREGRILLANPRLRELLSVWGDVDGHSVPEVIRQPEIDAALQEARQATATVVKELEISDPRERQLLMHAAAFPSEGPRSGTVAVFHDVSELRRVDRVRQDFIANASHELRTPLTAIQGFADTLATRDLSAEESRPGLDAIIRNTQRMTDLINDLLALSRIESERAPLEMSDVDVGRLCEMLLADFAPRLEIASLRAELHVQDCPPCHADRSALEQVLSNLLSNATRYSNPGGRVAIEARAVGERIEITVADTGIGIPKSDQERIFERFYRVDAARSRALGSTGLGLSIVKHLVHAMHGDIEVESEPEKGSRFTVSLPAALC